MKRLLTMALVLMMVLAAGAALAEDSPKTVIQLNDIRTASYEWDIPSSLSANFTNTSEKRLGNITISGKNGAEKPLMDEGAYILITLATGSGKDGDVAADRLGQVDGMVLTNTNKKTLTGRTYFVGGNGTGFKYDGIEKTALTIPVQFKFELTDEEQAFVDTFISATPFEGWVTYNCSYVTPE